MKFYRCPICGNIITVIEENEKRVSCCGKTLEELKSGTTTASVKKHVPVYKREDDKIIVTVGEVEHPMTEDHYIMFVALVNNQNINIVKLNSSDKPEAIFPYLKGSQIYAYCNLHGLWMNEVE